MNLKKELKRFWEFLKEDNWKSTIVSLILFLILIYFVVFPVLTFLTGTKYFLVIVESCSMHHSKEFEEIFSDSFYVENGISLEEAKKWNLKNGFTKGDIIFSIGPKNLAVGDVIIFDAESAGYKYPIIHRIIKINGNITTKGDNNRGILDVEKNIPKEKVMARSLYRIPYLGWIKLIFFDWRNPPEKRGFCK